MKPAPVTKPVEPAPAFHPAPETTSSAVTTAAPANPPKKGKKQKTFVAKEQPAPSTQANPSNPPKTQTPTEVAASKPQAKPPTKVPPGPSRYSTLEAPAPPVTPDQKQQLDALLQRYRADQITPDEYHKERSRIMGSH